MEYGKADINDWLKHRNMKTPRDRKIEPIDLVITTIIGLAIGLLIGVNAPQYKAYVYKDGSVKVMPVK